MNDIFNKLKDKLLITYKELLEVSTSLEKNILKVDSKDGRLEWGQKALQMNALKLRFVELAGIIKNDLGEPLINVSKEVEDLYTFYEISTKDIQESDSEEVKKIKEYLQSIKNGNT